MFKTLQAPRCLWEKAQIPLGTKDPCDLEPACLPGVSPASFSRRSSPLLPPSSARPAPTLQASGWRAAGLLAHQGPSLPAPLHTVLHPPAHSSLRTRFWADLCSILTHPTQLKGRGLHSHEKAKLYGLSVICRKPGSGEVTEAKGLGITPKVEGRGEGGFRTAQTPMGQGGVWRMPQWNVPAVLRLG